MKIFLKCIFCLSFVFSASSCSNDDDSIRYDNQLIGAWQLSKINTMAGTFEVEENQVVWQFNSNGKLFVNNNLENSMNLPSVEYNFHSDTYNHEILNQTVSSILINNQREGQFYKITNDTLLVDYGSYLDAPIYIFIR